MPSLAESQSCNDNATDYAQGVIDGAIVAGPFVRLACQRHLNDIRTGHARGLAWNAELAQYAIDFTRFVRHSKGEWRGRRLALAPWQQFIIGSAFGWMTKDDFGWRRRFRTIYDEVPKKNGKSTLCGFVGIYGLIGDGEPGAEIYAAASSKQQAMLVFGEAREMVKTSPELRTRIQILVKNLSDESTFSKFEPLSSDENTGDGINPHFAIVDEIHRIKKRDLLSVLQQGMGARRQPMLWIITTAGDDRPGTPYDDEHNYARKVLEGALIDDTYFAYIACPDEGDDPFAVDTWAKANPGLKISVKLADLEANAAKARNSVDQLAEFKRFRLNVRSSDSAAAIKMENWRRNTAGGDQPIDLEALHGRRCHSAIDLSAKADITCLVHVFPPVEAGERWVILPRFFVPAEGLAERAIRDRVPYAAWVEAGHIKATLGSRVDYRAVFEQLKIDAELFDISEIVFDPWNAGTLEADCEAEGMRVFEFPQRTSHFAFPTKEFLEMLPDGNFEHGSNPVLAWMASNLVLVRDHNGNPMPSKRNSTGRIDGIAAAIMALGKALTAEDNEDFLERGILVI